MEVIELEQWLQTLPLDEPVSIDDESVYMKVNQAGAELGVHFLAFEEPVTDQQLQGALQQGFQSALEFDAGWALSDDGCILLLTRWLPGVSGWTEVPEALEQLLNQADLLRTMESVVNVKTENIPSRDERRFRSKLMRGE